MTQEAAEMEAAQTRVALKREIRKWCVNHFGSSGLASEITDIFDLKALQDLKALTKMVDDLQGAATPQLKRLHINKHAIARNVKRLNGEEVQGTTALEGPIGIIHSKRDKQYARGVVIKGPSTIVYEPEKPLKCGARVWVETHAELEVTE